MPGILTSAPGLGLGALLLTVAMAGSARAAVEVTGLEDMLRENVLALMSLDNEPCELEERLVRREFRGTDPQIRNALAVHGYYSVGIESELSFGDECWTARFAIEPGPAVMLRNVDVRVDGDAADDPPFRALVQSNALEPGARLSHPDYESLKRQLQDLARTRGYAEARLTQNRIDIYPEELAADVTLHLSSGPRYRFGEITIEQDALENSFVDAYVEIEPGAPYNNDILADTYVALGDTGYFETIDVRPLAPDPETRTIPVRISMTVAPRRVISYGVGFSTDTGPRVRFGRQIRRLNRRGHQFSLNAQLAPIISEFTAEYRLPYGDPRYEWLSFDGGIKREETDTATSDSIEFGMRRVLERPGGWTRTQLISLVVEDFEIGSERGRGRLLMPGLNWMRLRADSALRPSNGSRYNIDIRAGLDRLGSDTDIAQITTSAKWIRSVNERGRILLRGQFGTMVVDEFGELPPSARFFAGGDNSVRGYPFESLGPENANGEVIGGERLAVASVEYEHRIKPLWSIAVFTDSGNAFTGTDLDARTSAGLGARWQSPLGPIRIDIGVPLNDPERGPRLHITLGPDL